jgi:hypothetical protein
VLDHQPDRVRPVPGAQNVLGVRGVFRHGVRAQPELRRYLLDARSQAQETNDLDAPRREANAGIKLRDDVASVH